MSESIQVEICAPERAKIELEAEEVLCPGEDGVFTVRFGHTPLLTTIIPGVLLIKGVRGQDHHFALSGGFAEVRPDKVLILADTFEDSDHIDIERARSAEERADARLKRHDEDTDLKRAELALARAAARIKASQRVGY